jgi:hypothetical protein
MKTSLKSIVPWLLLISIAIVGTPAHADTKPIYTGFFSDKAVSGYDVVAYFNAGKPSKGDKQFAHTHDGATWLFSSAANRDAFIKDPSRYSPQYGGYCAWAVSQGYTAAGDPEFWKIVDNKLYLNYDAAVQKKWETNIPDFIQAADKNWPQVLKK